MDVLHKLRTILGRKQSNVAKKLTQRIEKTRNSAKSCRAKASHRSSD